MTLLVGFDSAWTPGNSGAIAGLLLGGGACREIGPPQVVNFSEAEQAILDWQRQFGPDRTLVLLDQPTIVVNSSGQRPVEGIVSSSVSVRLGGMQPASQSRTEMFGAAAPLWNFLRRFGGAADPLGLTDGAQVIETYPVLALIALGWLQNGRAVSGTLPKYNPHRTKTFSLNDWRFVCERAAAFFTCRSMIGFAGWLSEAAQKTNPKKNDQDRLDACLCLIVAMWLKEGRECLMVGNLATGYIVVPHNPALLAELASRCRTTGREPNAWLRVFRLLTYAPDAESAVPAPLIPKLSGTSSAGGRRASPPPTLANQATKTTATKSTWTLPKIAALLDCHRQRATYGAVAGILGVLPRGLMNGCSKSPEYSWIVAASGTDKGRPTGYNDQEVHPECRRQIRENRGGVITRSEELLDWLYRSE